MRDVNIRSALLGHCVQLRLMEDHLVVRLKTQGRLFQLWCSKIYPAAIFSIEEGTIGSYRCRQQRLSVLSCYHHEDLAELPGPGFVYDAEDQRDQRLLPKLQTDPSGCQLSLVVVAELLNKKDRRLRFLVAIKKGPVLQSAHDILV